MEGVFPALDAAFNASFRELQIKVEDWNSGRNGIPK